MHRPLAAALLLTTALAVSACAPGSRVPAEPIAPVAPRSQRAQATYNYLKFEEARRAGNDEDAVAALRELLALDPRSEFYEAGADYLWRSGRLDEARKLLREGIATYPTSRALAVSLANTFYAEKRHADAALAMRNYLERVPDDWTVHKDLALIHLDAGDFASAIEDLSHVPEERRDAPILYYQAKANAGLGLNRVARELLREAVKKDAYFMEAWAELAFLYEVDGNFVEAERVYSRLLELGETGSDVYLRMISLNLKLNKPERALELYRQGPDGTNFGLEAATLFLDEKFYDQARAVLLPLSERDDAPGRIWFYLALLAYEGDRDATRALNYLERVPDNDPLYHRAARFRIHLLEDMGEGERALSLIRILAERFPDQSAYLDLEADYYRRQGDNARALDVLDQAVGRWPDDTDLLYARGVVLDKLERRDEAMRDMERIIVLDADHADALNFVGYLLADRGQDLERAEVLISRALKIEPDNGYIIDSMAWLHFRKGELDKAWDYIRRSVERVADVAEIWEHYGDIAAGLGLVDKAREGYRNSLELEPGNAAVKRKLGAL